MWCGGIIAVLTAVSLLWKIVLARPAKEVMESLRWWKKFQRDWDGEESQPGRDRVPGVMERLNMIDGEFRRNGGSSLRDQVVETRRDIEILSSRVEIVEARVLDIQHTLKSPTGKSA